jgi:hypothetical protein
LLKAVQTVGPALNFNLPLGSMDGGEDMIQMYGITNLQAPLHPLIRRSAGGVAAD